MRRDRAFFTAFCALVLAMMGFRVAWPFLPLYLADLRVPQSDLSWWSGVLEFVEDAMTTLVAPIWGLLGDRFGPRTMALRSTLCGALVVLLLAFAPNVYVALALMIASGALASVMAPLNALVAATTPADKLAATMSVMLSGVFFANAVGPLVGGVISDIAGFRAAFVCGAVMLAISGVLVATLTSGRRPVPAEPGTGEPAAAKPTLRAQLGLVARTPGVAAVAATSGLLYFGNMLLYPVLPLYVRGTHGLLSWGGHPQVATAAGIAVGVTGFSAMIAAVRTDAAVRRWGYRRVLGISVAVTALLYASVPLFDSFGYLVVVRAIAGVLVGVALSCAAALVALVAPAELGSTAYGVVSAFESAGSAGGFLAGGAIGSWLGLGTAFFVCAGGLGAAAVVGLAGLRSVQQARVATA